MFLFPLKDLVCKGLKVLYGFIDPMHQNIPNITYLLRLKKMVINLYCIEQTERVGISESESSVCVLFFPKIMWNQIIQRVGVRWDCIILSGDVLEILQSCTKPLIKLILEGRKWHVCGLKCEVCIYG